MQNGERFLLGEAWARAGDARKRNTSWILKLELCLKRSTSYDAEMNFSEAPHPSQ